MTVSTKNKYIVAFAATAVLALGLYGCGGGGGDEAMMMPPIEMPEDVDLSSVTAGFMAAAGMFTITAGQSHDHGDIAFSCAAGGADCEVVVEVDANGVVTAMSTGGMVTAMNSAAYNQRIETLATNEASLIHLATGADSIGSGEPLFANLFGALASHYRGVSQNNSGSRYAIALPWHDDQGELNFSISLGSGLSPEELDPVDWLGRAADTSSGGDTTLNEDMQHGLGGDWRAFEIRRERAGAGTWTINIATDANDAHALEQPWVGYGEFDQEISLSDIPALPAGQDWQGVLIEDMTAGTTHLAGSLDGVPGRFTCGSNPYCYLEIERGGASTGYYPGGGDVVFTPDDPNLGATTLRPVASTDRLPRANYLVFGNWLYVPQDITSSDDYDFGVLAGGGDPFSSDIYNLVGSATYAGSANGMYFTGRSSTGPSVDSFDADVTLMADFDSAELGGRVENFRFSGTATGLPSALQLESSFIDPYSLAAAGEVTDGQPASSWNGEWHAAFYGNGANPTDHPSGVAGTFGASNDEDGLVGSFGAYKQ